MAVKKPLREWGAWLPVPCLLINDLLLELATNLEREREMEEEEEEEGGDDRSERRMEEKKGMTKGKI